MYSEAFITDLKSRVAISEVIGRSVKLRKDGKEFRAIDNKSLTINDQKGIWFDHATNEGGDALAWLQKSQGLSFTDAVADLASIAGVPLPNGDGQARQPQQQKKQKLSDKREITATYDYTDAQGELIYQVVRLEWIEDGERCKTFRQRRPDPEEPNEWIWNLEGVKHGLYRVPDMREAGADEIVFLPEGEKDVETLIGLGLVATTNSGGAQNWRPDHAEALRGRDVVVLIDNDEPGRERGKAIVASLHGVAKRVRVLDFSHRDIWPTAPRGSDVTDWVKAREGTPEDLAAIVETLPDAKPAAVAHDDEPLPAGPQDYGSEPIAPAPHVPRQLRFTQFSKIQLSTRARYLVKGIIPNVGLVVVWGEPKCGKSFTVFDMAAHIAAGWQYRGRRVKQCPVVYFALEGQEGFVARVEAFRKAHQVSDIPFYLSADRIVLPQDGAAVVQSIRGQFPGVKPGVVVLDTLNRSLGGSENDPSDMGQYVRAADMIREAFNCVVIVIHHCGVEGARPRGHTSLTGAADAQIAVKRDDAGNIVATNRIHERRTAGRRDHQPPRTGHRRNGRRRRQHHLMRHPAGRRLNLQGQNEGHRTRRHRPSHPSRQHRGRRRDTIPQYPYPAKHPDNCRKNVASELLRRNVPRRHHTDSTSEGFCPGIQQAAGAKTHWKIWGSRVAGLKPGQPGQHPDNPDLSGDMLPGQTGHPPYKGVHCPAVRTAAAKEKGENFPSNTQTDGKEKIGAAPPSLPADDCPVLIGVDQIAAWLGISRGRCRGLVDDGTLPTFTMPGRATRCALKASVGAVMEEYSRRPGAAAKAPPRKRSA
jgi:hypothetical protein